MNKIETIEIELYVDKVGELERRDLETEKSLKNKLKTFTIREEISCKANWPLQQCDEQYYFVLPAGYIYCEHDVLPKVEKAETDFDVDLLDNYTLRVWIFAVTDWYFWDRWRSHIKLVINFVGINSVASQSERDAIGCKPLPF